MSTPEPGVVHAADQAFHDLTVKQRNHAWAESARHKAERDEARAEVERLRGIFARLATTETTIGDDRAIKAACQAALHAGLAASQCSVCLSTDQDRDEGHGCDGCVPLGEWPSIAWDRARPVGGFADTVSLQHRATEGAARTLCGLTIPWGRVVPGDSRRCVRCDAIATSRAEAE